MRDPFKGFCSPFFYWIRHRFFSLESRIRIRSNSTLLPGSDFPSWSNLGPIFFLEGSDPDPVNSNPLVFPIFFQAFFLEGQIRSISTLFRFSFRLVSDSDFFFLEGSDSDPLNLNSDPKVWLKALKFNEAIKVEEEKLMRNLSRRAAIIKLRLAKLLQLPMVPKLTGFSLRTAHR